MNNISLPRTLLCGYCDCSEFGTLKTSPERTAKSFEIEYYLENAFETYLNGEKIPIYADRILIAKPGDVRYSRLPFKTAFLKYHITFLQICHIKIFLIQVLNLKPAAKVVFQDRHLYHQA